MKDAKKSLGELKNNFDWDNSALETFKNWNNQLDALALDKTYLELPQSKRITEYFKTMLANANRELITNRELIDIQRNKLFAIKDIAEELLPRFSLEDNLKQSSLIEREIEEEIKNNKQ